MRGAINIFLLLLLASCGASVESDVVVDEQVSIFPDYRDITAPCNIAPLNIQIMEQGDHFYATYSGRGCSFTVDSSSPEISLPEGRWKEFREALVGEEFTITIMVERDGKIVEYPPITNRFSKSEIDSHLVYRKIAPGYIGWNRIGIYERDLTSFSESTIVDNRSNDRGCMNCHTFQSHNPDNMMLHVRKNGPGTVIKCGQEIIKVDLKVGEMISGGAYTSWHPSKPYIAYSVNSTVQVFHQTGTKPIDVVDSSSDLIVYDIAENIIYSAPSIYSEQHLESFPDWSPDGEYIYFTRAEAPISMDSITDIRYNLYRIGFDSDSKQFSEPELLYDAISEGKSVSFPKSSPDGKYVVFTMSDYGNFSVWHPESDLYIMDCESGSVRAADEINSNDVDSYHSWSSDGKWLVVSSKRIDGLWSRPYFAEFDAENGTFSKPMLMPQERSLDYDYQLYSYNIPNFVTGEVKGKHEIRRAVSVDNAVKSKAIIINK